MPDISSLRFRNLDVFIAGQLHFYSERWEKIAALSSSDRADEVLAWINKDVSLYVFPGHSRETLRVVLIILTCHPCTELDNNKSCNFLDFIDKTLLERACSGAISVQGRVGEIDRARHLIMPLTVEPSKPRLCHGNRFFKPVHG